MKRPRPNNVEQSKKSENRNSQDVWRHAAPDRAPGRPRQPRECARGAWPVTDSDLRPGARGAGRRPPPGRAAWFTFWCPDFLRRGGRPAARGPDPGRRAPPRERTGADGCSARRHPGRARRTARARPRPRFPRFILGLAEPSSKQTHAEAWRPRDRARARAKLKRDPLCIWARHLAPVWPAAGRARGNYSPDKSALGERLFPGPRNKFRPRAAPAGAPPAPRGLRAPALTDSIRP